MTAPLLHPSLHFCLSIYQLYSPPPHFQSSLSITASPPLTTLSLSPFPLFFLPAGFPLPLSMLFFTACSQLGLFGPTIAWQVLHRVTEAVFDDDAVHGGFWHAQFLPDWSFRLAVLPQVHHTLTLQDIVLLGLQARQGFCGGRKVAHCRHWRGSEWASSSSKIRSERVEQY